MAHVKDQNRAAVAIDFVIVVVGVFIGIQVSNWNESRADMTRSSSYIERLMEDLQVDINTIEDRLNFWDSVTSYGRQALDYSDSGTLKTADSWPVLLAYFQASQLAEFYSRSTTFSELQSAGELNLIPDTDVRTKLAEYYRLSSNPILVERPKYRVTIRERIPLDVQLYIWEYCYRSDDEPGTQEFVDCPAPRGVSTDALLRRIGQDEDIIGELTYWMSNMRVAKLISRSTLRYATELRAQLAQLQADH